jgi:hypothetical protein
MEKHLKKHLFSYETLKSLAKLGEALRSIHNRMAREDYVLRDGKVVSKADT